MLAVHNFNLSTQIYRVYFEGKKNKNHGKWDQMHCDFTKV